MHWISFAQEAGIPKLPDSLKELADEIRHDLESVPKLPSGMPDICKCSKEVKEKLETLINAANKEGIKLPPLPKCPKA